MPLSDLLIRQSKAQNKPYILKDERGLSLYVASNGKKIWYFRYRLYGKQTRFPLGNFPTISLKEARTMRDEALVTLARGIDPLAARRQEKIEHIEAQGNTFNAINEKWYAHRCLSLKEGRQTTRCTIKRVFAKDVLPFIGKRPISEIRRTDLLGLLARVEQRRALSVAERIRGWLNQLFRFALVTLPGLGHNPATDLDVVAAPQPPVRHNPHLRMDELPKLLQRLRSYRL
jgi:hypothetical protein